MDHEVSKTARARDEGARPIAVCGDDVSTSIAPLLYLSCWSLVPAYIPWRAKGSSIDGDTPVALKRAKVWSGDSTSFEVSAST